MADLVLLTKLLETALGRRKLLEVGVLGLAALALPACLPSAGDPIGGTSGGANLGPGPGGGGGSGGGGSSGSGTTGGGGTSGATTGGGGTTGGAACTDDANTLVLSLAQNPSLAQVGGTVALSDNRYSDPTCQQPGFIVAQPSEGKFVAYSSSCTHYCCSVYQQGNQLFCPCHGSIFDLNGNVLRGPAASPLPSIPVCFDGANLHLQLA